MAPPPFTVYKKPIQSAVQTARAIAQGVAQQSNETLKTAQDQLGIPRAEVTPSTETQTEVPEVITDIREQGVDAIDREAIARKESAMLAQLEAQLSSLRHRRTQELAQYAERTQMQMQDNSPQQTAPVEAQGKVSKAIGRAKKAVSSIISGRKQGETKSGAGKG